MECCHWNPNNLNNKLQEKQEVVRVKGVSTWQPYQSTWKSSKSQKHPPGIVKCVKTEKIGPKIHRLHLQPKDHRATNYPFHSQAHALSQKRAMHEEKQAQKSGEKKWRTP